MDTHDAGIVVREARVSMELTTDHMTMLNVFLTFDVEVWCRNWDNIDDDFPDAFSRYVYGRSPKGDFALPMILRLLSEHGLHGTFFVEPLFACRVGREYLAEIVTLIRDAGQDVQLHLHPEWTDEARPRFLATATKKRQHLFQYSLAEQIELIAKGKAMLMEAGAEGICAFRAGSYACNRATLQALRENGIRYDSSSNPSRSWSGADFNAQERGQRVMTIEEIIEFPITVFKDRPVHLRQVQVGSTSLNEFMHLIRQAHEQKRTAFVIVSHNFEMLVPDSKRPNSIVVRRFVGLCRFLANNSRSYPTSIFPESSAVIDRSEPSLLTSSLWRTAMRTLEQTRQRFNR